LVLARAAESQTTNNFPVIADFEDGVPDGWFQYGDGGTVVNASVPTIPDSDPLALPGQVGPNNVLSVTANVPTWAGFGAGLNPAQDWSDYDALSFWFYGENSGTTHEVEIQTVPGDDRRAQFVDNFTGWRQIILPFHTFGAGGAYDVSQVDNWVFVLDGTDGWFLLDNLQLVNLQPFADFEGGVPAGWFVYGDGGTSVNASVVTIADSDPVALPGQIGNNDVLSVTANVPTWAGFGAALRPGPRLERYAGSQLLVLRRKFRRRSMSLKSKPCKTMTAAPNLWMISPAGSSSRSPLPHLATPLTTFPRS
jgi:hypothetical protein